MLFTPSGTFYSKIQFKTEDEVEKVAVDNFELLFGDYSILLPKSLIRTSGGKGGGIRDCRNQNIGRMLSF